MSSAAPTPNEEDDLFNFDDLFRGPTTAETAAAIAPALPATAARVATTPSKPAPVAAPAAAVNTPGQLPLVKAVTPKAAVAAQAQALAAPLPADGQPRRISKLTIVSLGLATLLNLALIGVVWRSMSGVGSALREVGDQVARASESTHAQPVASAQEWPNLQASVAAPASSESEQALAAATEDLAQGDFERARARLYSVLSVLDRFDAKLRPNLSSRAQVMIADSYRMQADRVEQDGAARAGGSGFMAVPEEQH